MSGGPGLSAEQVARIARDRGLITVNQYDQSPSALRFRRALYRAVKKGLVRRAKSPPSRAVYVPVKDA